MALSGRHCHYTSLAVQGPIIPYTQQMADDRGLLHTYAHIYIVIYIYMTTNKHLRTADMTIN